MHYTPGGAAGIGAAICRRFFQEGAKVRSYARVEWTIDASAG